MKYRMYGDKLELVRWVLTESYEFEGKELSNTYTAVTDAERDKLMERYPGAVVAKIDNAGYEWLNGMTFTQEQLSSGELEKAIELGEYEYMQYRAMSDPIYRDLDFDMRLALLESGVSINELSSVY